MVVMHDRVEGGYYRTCTAARMQLEGRNSWQAAKYRVAACLAINARSKGSCNK